MKGRHHSREHGGPRVVLVGGGRGFTQRFADQLPGPRARRRDFFHLSAQIVRGKLLSCGFDLRDQFEKRIDEGVWMIEQVLERGVGSAEVDFASFRIHGLLAD